MSGFAKTKFPGLDEMPSSCGSAFVSAFDLQNALRRGCLRTRYTVGTSVHSRRAFRLSDSGLTRALPGAGLEGQLLLRPSEASASSS